VVRCANSGISGFIAPTGAAIQRVPARRAIAAAATIVPQTERTLYVRFGDWLPLVMLVIAIGTVAQWWHATTSSRDSAQRSR
jgi:apolipoprotein N-acyltransferase